MKYYVLLFIAIYAVTSLAVYSYELFAYDQYLILTGVVIIIGSLWMPIISKYHRKRYTALSNKNQTYLSYISSVGIPEYVYRRSLDEKMQLHYLTHLSGSDTKKLDIFIQDKEHAFSNMIDRRDIDSVKLFLQNAYNQNRKYLLEYRFFDYSRGLIVVIDKGNIFRGDNGEVLCDGIIISKTNICPNQFKQKHSFSQHTKQTSLLQRLTPYSKQQTPYQKEYLQNNITALEHNAKTRNKLLGFALIEIDFYKMLSVVYGMASLSVYVFELHALITQACRDEDLVLYWNKKSLLLIQEVASINALISTSEKLRMTIEMHTFDKDVRLTCSIGLTLHNDQQTLEKTLNNVNSALETSKRNGHNKVSAFAS